MRVGVARPLVAFERLPRGAGLLVESDRAADIREISLHYKDFSSEKGGIMVLDDFGIPLEAQAAADDLDGPAAARPFEGAVPEGFAPRGSPSTRRASATSSTRNLDKVAARGECDLMQDVAGPVVTRVIGSFIGSPEELDARTSSARTSRSASATRTCGRTSTTSRR